MTTCDVRLASSSYKIEYKYPISLPQIRLLLTTEHGHTLYFLTYLLICYPNNILGYKLYELEIKHQDGVLFVIKNNHGTHVCICVITVVCYSYEISCSK